MPKLRVGILCGGRSAEHQISLLSAKNIARCLDPAKYAVSIIGVDEEGKWHLLPPDDFLLFPDDPTQVALKASSTQIALLPYTDHRAPVDVLFPILHGTYGEDGTAQGLFKLAGIPFVGAGVLGSSIGMDKEVMKRLLRDAGLPIARFRVVTESDRLKPEELVRELGLPLFIKPANLGSSIGITKVKKLEELEGAIELALKYDLKALVEESIQGREVECSVLGNEHPIASLPGEIRTGQEFNSYVAKYLDSAGSTCLIPAPVSPELTEKIRARACLTYKVLCCEGLARVDMFLRPDGEVLINEINTLPGCTDTSPFLKLWNASGWTSAQVVEKLIELALDRFAKEQRLLTRYVKELDPYS
jgi:D-alanine-D-alanine ligase